MVLPDGNPETERGAAMMDEKQLELEYRNMKRQAAPDLWDRIEKNLKEHPERVVAAAEPQKGAVDKTVSICSKISRQFC